MADRHEIELRERPGPNPPGLLASIKNDVQALFSAAAEGAGNYVRGKGDAEVAKALEIKGRVLAEIGKLEQEWERLAHEREKAEAASKNERNRDNNLHKQKMYELQTQRIAAQAEALQKVVASLKALADLGVVVEIRVVTRLLAGVTPKFAGGGPG